VDLFQLLVGELLRDRYVFRLYVAGGTRRSIVAIANARSICEEYLSGHYELEVVDVDQQPGTAQRAQVVALPTLVKEQPLPARRFVGDLSNTEQILAGLSLTHDA
jgi:circadian clock protein KaiB